MTYFFNYLTFSMVLLCMITQQIASDNVQVVDLNLWSLNNANKTIKKVNLKAPLSVYSALASEYGDILDSENDEKLRWIAYDNWTFYTSFKITLVKLQSVNLTLNGIDTVATIHLNDHEIGRTDNMFVRYSFEVTNILKVNNLLEIKIKSPILMAKERADAFKAKGLNYPPDCPHTRTNGECHRNMLRKMQMSFGGDLSLAAPSIGIWKSVDLEYYEVAIMRDVDVAIRRNDTHWILDIRVFLSTGIRDKFYADLIFIAAELLDDPLQLDKKRVSYTSPQINFEVAIPQERVELWWPNGYGKQKLYPLYFAVQCWVNENGPRMDSRTKSQKTITIGFRTIELEEDDDEFGRSFYFKINGQPIFIKGASYVPSHVWPELSYQESRVEHIIKAAKESHLNMIRVWGGGLYEADIFYNLTDHHGLLVWQEMAFSAATYPITDEFVDSVRLEVTQNAQRLGYHPSLCMLVTNNEIELYLAKNKTEFGTDSKRLEAEYKQLFMGTIRHELNIISRNDFNPRAGPMISTPSMGVEESKKDLSTDPQNPNYGDVHFWDDEKDGWDPTIYPRARFITEYGFQSLPILASWNRTMYKNDDLATIVKHRQHDSKAFIPMLQMISRHFGLPLMDWEDDIEIYIYLSQVSQAMATKTATDFFRSQRTHKRTMGALYWQLNDAWVAPTWSSIDYFGNYKLLWYWSKQFMAPTSIIALLDLKVQRINVTVTKEDYVDDIEQPQKYNITMLTYLWSELYFRKSITYEITLSSNGLYFDSIDMATVFNNIFSRTNCFLKFELHQKDTIIASTYLFPGKFHYSTGMSDPDLKMELSSHVFFDRNAYTYYSITFTVQKPALFVYIEIHHPDVNKYVLSENGFVLTEPVKVIHLELEANNDTCLTLSEENVRVFTVNHILVGGKTQIKKPELKTCPTVTEADGFLEMMTSTLSHISR